MKRRDFLLILGGVASGYTVLALEEIIRIGQLNQQNYQATLQAQALQALKNSAKVVYDTPDWKITSVPWQPVDITDKITDLLTREEKEDFLSEMAHNIYWKRSSNNRWLASDLSEAIGPYIASDVGKLIKKLPPETGRILFDSEAKKYYSLSILDQSLIFLEMPAGYEIGYTFNDGVVFDNGIVVTNIMGSSPDPNNSGRDSLSSEIVSDINNRRKLFIVKRYSQNNQKMSISGDGNHIELDGIAGGFDIVSIPDQNVIYKNDKDWFLAMNYDASVIVVHPMSGEANSYDIFDIRANKRTLLTYQDLTKVLFKISPNGNNVACMVQAFGSSFIEVITPEYRYNIIAYQNNQDYPLSISDSGTLEAATGTYKLVNGDYIWATPNREPPKNLSVSKSAR